jgi:hypothetical protein
MRRCVAWQDKPNGRASMRISLRRSEGTLRDRVCCGACRVNSELTSVLGEGVGNTRCGSDDEGFVADCVGVYFHGAAGVHSDPSS